MVLSWLIHSVSLDLFTGIVYSSNARLVWEDLRERFDKVNGSRIYVLHRETHSLHQGSLSISAYYNKLKELWDEYYTLVPLPSCGCPSSISYVDHVQQQKLLQFLMGLNDNFQNARSQILLLNPLPSLNQAYAMVLQDEAQRLVTSISLNPSSETVALVARGSATKGSKTKFSGDCNYCRVKGCKGRPRRRR